VRIAVTGGAGFIGSHLVDALLDTGHEVTVLDDFSTGYHANLATARGRPGLTVEHVHLDRDERRTATLLAGHAAVIHLAANADVRYGWQSTRRDLQHNVVATLNVLDGMRQSGVRRILFASTGSVYGESAVVPTPEDAPFPRQTSLYGASKAAAEGYLAAYAEADAASVTVFRFVSILGPRYSHGHVIDFVRRLVADPTQLDVLGNGDQRKSYLDVSDCVTALLARLAETPTFEVFNLGVDDSCTVKDSARWICERLGVDPALRFGTGDRGWIGDNPCIYLDTTKIRSTGWTPRFGIRAAVERTVDSLLAEQWRLDARDGGRRTEDEPDATAIGAVGTTRT
jgi:UDP-glucose 4-epimerase